MILSSGLSAVAKADTSPGGLDYTSPYIDPQRECLTEGMINPPGKSYRYLFSRDCKVVHVLPPAMLNQGVKGEGVNLEACVGVAASRNTINTIDQRIDANQSRLLRLEVELDKARSVGERDAIQSRIKFIENSLKDLAVQKTEKVKDFKESYAQLPGAKFVVTLNGDVEQGDMNEIRAYNSANLNIRTKVKEKTTGPDGKVIEKEYYTIEISALRPAAIEQSIYSFAYKLPKDALENGGIVSTNIPSLQYFEQPGGQTGLIHVKGRGALSGEVLMSVTTACGKTKKGSDGKLELEEKADPFFVVNRTFFVQEMFGQGYTASLNVDKAVEQITKYTVTHTNQGFQKSAVFLPIIRANVEEIMTFKWASEFDNGKGVSTKDILELKQAVATKLVDDYVEKLMEVGAITKVPDRSIAPVEGRNVDELRQGHRCWTEKDGGVSGWLGRRHEVCGDFTYTVQVWRDGVTNDEVRRSLKLAAGSSDSMLIHTTAPFYFSTAFQNK
jgi:hypothetical protein